MGGDSATVADVVQETFLAAARSARRFNPRRGSLWTWLWTIAQRQVALTYRKQKPMIALGQSQQWWAALDGAKTEIPLDILESEELAELVRCTLRELPGDYQSLLLAKYVDNQPTERIAGQMDCSEVAIRSKLARARKAFRKAFKKTVHSIQKKQEASL
jgi:RNA polymerase sigma-70 factor (ECF subfamily)